MVRRIVVLAARGIKLTKGPFEKTSGNDYNRANLKMSI